MLVIIQTYIKTSLYFNALLKIMISSKFLIKILWIIFFLKFIDKNCFLNFELLDYFQIIHCIIFLD